MSTSTCDEYALVKIDSKEVIADFFHRHQLALHLYEVGDLDDFFYPLTTWYALVKQHDEVRSDEVYFISLLYESPGLTVLLSFGSDQDQLGVTALSLLQPLLPPVFYSQLSPHFLPTFATRYTMDSHGLYLKMVVNDLTKAKEAAQQAVTGNAASRLQSSDLNHIQSFYQEAYPGNWFDARMLETGQFFGIWDEAEAAKRRLKAVAGIHVFSPTYQVAALGNIATHPTYRRQGLARFVTSAVMLSLLEAGVTTIGLNVKADNKAAIAMYKSLAFHEVAFYE